MENEESREIRFRIWKERKNRIDSKRGDTGTRQTDFKYFVTVKRMIPPERIIIGRIHNGRVD